MPLWCALLFLLLAVPATRVRVRAADEAAPAPVAPLSLEATLSRVAARSIELDNLKKQLHGAELELQTVSPKYLPNLAAAAQYRFDNGETNDYAYGRVIPFLTVSYDFLDTGSDLYKRRWQAMKEYFQAEESLVDSRDKLYLEAASGYFNLLLARKRSELAARYLKQSRIVIDKAQIEYRDGKIPRVELLKKEADSARESLKELKQRHELETAEMDLAGLLDLPEVAVGEEPAGEETFYEVSPDRLKNYVAGHNEHLRLMDDVAGQLPKFRELVDRLKWPSVKLETYLGEKYADYFGPGNNNYGVRLTVSKDLFDNGDGKRKREKMRLEIDELEASTRARQEEYYRKLELLRSKFANAGEEVRQAREQLRMARELNDLFLKSYDLGVASSADLEKNRDTLQANEFEYLEARSRYRESEFALKVQAGVSAPEELARSGPEWLVDTEAGNPAGYAKEKN